MERAELKQWTKQKIKGKWWKILGASIIVSVVSLAFQSVSNKVADNAALIGDLIVIIGNMVVFILQVGLVSFMINFITDKEYNYDQIWSKFSNLKLLIKVYWHQFIIVFLHTLLLIIPGIIKGYGYSLVNYILADNPEMSSTEILKLSEEMMRGHKMDLFILQISFIGWHLLAILTLGILEIWIIPYQQTATTKFLNDIKVNYSATKKTETAATA